MILNSIIQYVVSFVLLLVGMFFTISAIILVFTEDKERRNEKQEEKEFEENKYNW